MDHAWVVLFDGVNLYTLPGAYPKVARPPPNPPSPTFSGGIVGVLGAVGC